jgi:cohesin complex subunit SA-1/2
MDISNNDVTSTPVATGSRRKSGRAVRVPEKFAPETAPASAKRKRDDDENENENDASDVDEEAEASDATAESGEEEQPRLSRRKGKGKAPAPRKPAAKKPKVNGTAAHEEEDEEAAPAVKLPSRPKTASRKVGIADKNAEGLYGERVCGFLIGTLLTYVLADVYTSGDSPEEVATQWLHKYGEDGPKAMTDLVNFLLKSAGCNIQVNQHDIEDLDNVENRLGDVQEEFQSVSLQNGILDKSILRRLQQNVTDYPLISKAKSSHAFRASLIGFFDSLIEVMHQSGTLFEEQALIGNIHHWVATTSSSTSRPFRHTATLVALTITSALCDVANKEIETAAKVQRQLEGEKKKKSANKARVAEFQKKVADNKRNKEFIEDQIKDFYDTIYVHRYRDIDPKIRIECVEALGNWILTLPSLFFEGQYLRYIGWMLSDTHGPMRQENVKQLVKIMKNPSNHGGMRHFIERFLPRLVEMATQDSEPGVRAVSVDLMVLIREAGMLEPENIDVIGKLIFDTEPRVRKAVVGFFVESIKDFYEAKIDELGGEEALEDLLTVDDEEDFDTPRAGWIRLKCLAEILLSYDSQDQEDNPSQIDSAEFLNMSGSDSRFSLAAQALYDKITELKDWDMLAGYLLFDHSSRATGNETERALRKSFKPTEEEELVLLEILNAVVKLSLTQAHEPANKKKGAKDEASEAKENAARRLAGLIPRLLKKYGADPRTATVVLRLEHVLNLGVFQELRQDSTVYAKLLDEISAQFNSHADKGVLKEAGAAFLHAREFEELDEVTGNKISSLWEDTTNALRKINKAGEISVRGAFKNKILLELSQNLSRLSQLASISDPVEILEAHSGKGPSALTILTDTIARGVFEESIDEAVDAMEDEIVISAIRAAMFYFMWKVRALKGAIASGEEISDTEIDQLKEAQETFTTNLTAAFSSRSTLDPVRLLGAGTFLDMHVLFAFLRAPKPKGKNAGEKDTNDNGYLQTLTKEVIPAAQTELTLIFDGLEKQFAKRSKKKLAEPSDDEAPEDLDEEPEDDEDEEVTESERLADTLKAEKELCDFTSKLVLAIIAQVLDVSGPAKGKLRSRIQRNRQRLGPNFKDVVAYLDEPKPKAKKGQKNKAADAKKKAEKSEELVEEEEEEDDPFADVEPEEGTVEDLRRRELLEEEPEGDANGEGEGAGPPEEDDNDVMGD